MQTEVSTQLNGGSLVRLHVSPEEQVLIDYVTQFAPLTRQEISIMLDHVTIKTFPKGTILLREGDVERSCYFVLKGCIRQYYLVDGEEKTTAFFTEGQPVTVSGFPFDDNISKSYLACVEDCTVVEGKPEDEADFFEKLPRFEEISRVGLETELKKSHDALSEFILTRPEDRYLNLLHTRPDLIDRVPQYQLASYLGVTPESLSRIRKRIMAK